MNKRKLLFRDVLLMAVAVLILFYVAGCGSWQKTAMVTAETLGIVKDNARDLMQEKCRQPETTEAECEKMRMLYNKATVAYVNMVDLAVVAVETNDNRKYIEAKQELIRILNNMQTLLGRGAIQ